jgi:hypothetical protein
LSSGRISQENEIGGACRTQDEDYETLRILVRKLKHMNIYGNNIKINSNSMTKEMIISEY